MSAPVGGHDRNTIRVPRETQVRASQDPTQYAPQKVVRVDVQEEYDRVSVVPAKLFMSLSDVDVDVSAENAAFR